MRRLDLNRIIIHKELKFNLKNQNNFLKNLYDFLNNYMILNYDLLYLIII